MGAGGTIEPGQQLNTDRKARRFKSTFDFNTQFIVTWEHLKTTTPTNKVPLPVLGIESQVSGMATKLNPEVVSAAAKELVEFINRGPSPYHVVEECKRQLKEHKFVELKEKESWDVQQEGKYFVVNNSSTIIAFAVGGKFKPGNGFTMFGAHTDSPCLKVKPRSFRGKCDYLQVGVECYGGGIWHTWFDRDLKLAGRVMTRRNGLSHHLVHIDRPILKIPNLCIHLARDLHTQFSFNKENHVLPIIATSAAEEQLQRKGFAGAGSSHQPILISLISEAIGCKPEEIMDFDLHLADCQPAVIGGALNEFLFAPRLDNLFNCFVGLKGLINSLDTLSTDTNVRMIAFYDNEEVGSSSVQGAASALTHQILRRISSGGSVVAFEEAVPKSFLVSADQAHAVHPNYPEKHEQQHTPKLHQGPVLKINSNQKYATTAITSSIIREVARRANVPLQEVVVRNDSTCGSTIGPIMSTKLAIRTMDIGSPQLSMHSIREMACTTGVSQAIRLYTAYFNEFKEIDGMVTYT